MIACAAPTCRLLIADRGFQRFGLANVIREAGFPIDDCPRESEGLRKLGLLEMEVLLEIDAGQCSLTNFFPAAFRLEAWKAFVCSHVIDSQPTLVLIRKDGLDPSKAPAANREMVAMLNAVMAPPQNSFVNAQTASSRAKAETIADLFAPEEDALPTSEPHLTKEVVHDLNYLLTIVRRNCHHLLRDSALAERERVLIKEISQASTRTSLLADHLILLPRPLSAEGHFMNDQAAAATNTADIVLLVEDEAMVRSIFRRILQENGYFVLEAGNGWEAINLAQHFSYPIRLLVTDLSLPKMNGIELAGLVTSLHPETRVLYLSGYSEGILPDDHALDKDVAFLQKPFKADALVQKVRDILAN